MTPGLLPTGLITIGVGIAFTIVNRKEIALGLRSRKWPSVRGRIVTIDYTEEIANDLDSGTMVPTSSMSRTQRVIYTYDVDEITYQGLLLDCEQLMANSEFDFDTGNLVEVFYNPLTPKEHVLKPGIDTVVLLGPLAVAIGVVISAMAIAFPWVGY